jgi:hypothetical protein
MSGRIKPRFNTVNTKDRHWTRTWASFSHFLPSQTKIYITLSPHILLRFPVCHMQENLIFIRKFSDSCPSDSYIIWDISCFPKIPQGGQHAHRRVRQRFAVAWQILWNLKLWHSMHGNTVFLSEFLLHIQYVHVHLYITVSMENMSDSI